MMGSQLELLLLRAMSESVPMHLWVSVVHVITTEHEGVTSWGSHWTTTHWMRSSGKLAPFLTGCSTVGLTLVAGV